MYLNKSKLYIKESNIFIDDEIIFDYKDYIKAYEKMGTEEDEVFCLIFSKFGIDDKNIVCKYFTDLYNNIIINNISNYIMDLSKDFECMNTINTTYENNINIDSLLSLEELFLSVLKCLIKSKQYNKQVFNDSLYLKNIRGNDIDGNIKEKMKVDDYKKSIRFFIDYETDEVKDISEKLKKDLIDFDFVKAIKKNDRYLLPIYIDHDNLLKEDFKDYEEYLPAWTSFAYINMLEKIHDYFKVIYGIDSQKGLSNDSLSIALINLLDYEIRTMPKGVKKSIEAGRQSTGKSFIIDDKVEKVRICKELLMTLKAKDIFNSSPKIVNLMEIE